MPYVLYEVDQAGNAYEIECSESFSHICKQSVLAKRARPSYQFYIINPDLTDVDFNGLTEEEEELLPFTYGSSDPLF